MPSQPLSCHSLPLLSLAGSKVILVRPRRLRPFRVVVACHQMSQGCGCGDALCVYACVPACQSAAPYGPFSFLGMVHCCDNENAADLYRILPPPSTSPINSATCPQLDFILMPPPLLSPPFFGGDFRAAQAAMHRTPCRDRGTGLYRLSIAVAVPQLPFLHVVRCSKPATTPFSNFNCRTPVARHCPL